MWPERGLQWVQRRAKQQLGGHFICPVAIFPRALLAFICNFVKSQGAIFGNVASATFKSKLRVPSVLTCAAVQIFQNQDILFKIQHLS